MTPDPRRARLEALLATEATQKLTPAEEQELDALLLTFPEEDPDAFELAAAAVHLAVSPPPEEMPAALAEKLHLASVAVTPAPPRVARPARPTRRAWAERAGWAVAAGLAGVLVFTNWPKTEKPVQLAGKSFVGDAAGATASVTWDQAKQQGEFKVSGLKPNDPAKEQYQLWIIDPAQAHPVPVDGGVFDVHPDGTATFSVRSPIHVGDAQAFAISKEKPGGAVTPTMPQVVLVMKPKA